MTKNIFLDIDHFQLSKHKEQAFGDVVQTKKISKHDAISILSDGLGSGIKANVLASLTSRMALKYFEEKIDVHKAARIIMQTLPVCKERKLRYSTFTTAIIENGDNAQIIEYENPPFMFFRENIPLDINKKKITFQSEIEGHNTITYTKVPLQLGDRIIFFSDGVTQAGTGLPKTKNWQSNEISDFIASLINNNKTISSSMLSKKIVQKAASLDSYKPMDDITCTVIYIRKPRKCIVITGPPYHKENDLLFARKGQNFEGSKIICGGTTATIIGRELKIDFKLDYQKQATGTPPQSTSGYYDLVTEGIITLSGVAEFLHRGLTSSPNDPIIKHLLGLLLNSDQIHFLVGTRINESHQDPKLPVELDIRRNVVKKISRILHEQYMKETSIEFI